MATEVTMPKLTDSMEEGRIVEWKVAPGDAVSEGDVLAEIETDKAVMELESFWVGTVGELLREAGDVVPVGEVIARIREGRETATSEAGADVPGEQRREESPPVAARKEEEDLKEKGGDEVHPPEAPAAKTSMPAVEETPLPGAHPLSERGGRESPRPASPEPKVPVSSSSEAESEAEHPRTGVRASPRARKLAREKGIGLANVTGTGPEGRVLSADVEAAAGPGPLNALPPGSAAPADEELPPVSFAKGEAEVEDVSFYQKASIRRVVASKHVIPHFYITKAVRADKLLKRKASEADGSRASLTHLLLRACVLALTKFPDGNRSYDRGRWIRWKNVNLGLAIQTDAGLVVGVLRDAAGKDLPWIAEKTRQLVERARAGKLKAGERSNATFTLSNLGAYDVESFSAIINPPSAMTLAVGSVLDSPVVEEGKLTVGSVLRLTLSCDHRIVDGVLGAEFLGEVKRLLENPREL